METERLNKLDISNEISFFNGFYIFVEQLLGPIDLLLFNDGIKVLI